MSAQISFNPVLTTVASGSFNVSSSGFIQGTAQNDPAVRNALAGGVLASTETLPMWGGVGITENVPYTSNNSYPQNNLGSLIGRAANLTAGATGQLTGFSVFDQNQAATTTPQSPVPLSGTSMAVNYYRLGSGARIAVAMDPILASLSGSVITTPVAWDFTNQLLVPYEASAYTISSAVYTTGTGALALTLSTTPAFSAGDAVVLSSLTGTGSYASLNGTWTVTSVAGYVVTVAATAGLTATVTGGSLAEAGGTGSTSILPVKVLDFNIGNSMTVSYSATTGFATWNRSGSTAIILI